MLTDAGGGKTGPRRWVPEEGRDGRTSLATSPAAAQLLSVPICTCGFYSDPMALSSQLTPSGSASGPSNRHMEEPWLDRNCLPEKCETGEFRW